MDLSKLQTEQSRADLADLDLRPAGDLVALMVDEEQRVHRALEQARPSIAAAVDAIVAHLERGGRMIYAGAGTAGRLGVLDAAECGPTFNTDRVVAIVAGGQVASTTAREGAEDDLDAAPRALTELGIDERDVVVGVAASGRTPFTLAALERAREAGCLTVAVVANPATPLAAAAEHVIEVLTGPEVVAGSTRLKAGTAQKAVLNILSTATMVQLGKTFGNLMVDVRTTNDKLRDRARRIITQATGVDLDRAASALVDSGGEVKTAIVAVLGEVDADTARSWLSEADGRVRGALDGHRD